MMLKILLLGNTGQLGWELHRTLQPLGKVVALDYPEVNMADTVSIRKTVQEHCPEVIINATAYTAVDKAESEPELAEAINATGPAVLAEESHKLNALLIHFSTDYVFDGKKGSPYTETDAPNPINVYGLTKLHGEQAIQAVGGAYLILRTSWVYSLRRESFVSKVLEWARTQKTLRIVDDQIANPTWARMLAEITAQVLARGEEYIHERAGLYHLAGDGYASRLEWARKILEFDPHRETQVCKEILPALTNDFPTPAQRPLFSALNCDNFAATFTLHPAGTSRVLRGLRLPPWEAAMRMAMER
ncbi:MAG: dTDP-4-dehydrorhamnose reductase [Anaerolineae bacterium CG2_30_58_95]|nr:MAG: dTDP-4-dehydrorhamnose reductase [Anaerolineae bacterium CG2_30_58_95]